MQPRTLGNRGEVTIDHAQDPGEPSERRGQARKLLIAELRDAVGDEAVERADLDVDRALDSKPRSLQGALVSSRLLLIVLGAALLVVGVVASLATGSWVWFAVALGAHALLSGLVVATTLALSTQVEKPGPTTVTALEADGVADPEGALNDLVEQVAGQQEGGRAKRTLAQEDDTIRPEEDRAAAAAAQQGASTPASEPTTPRG